MGGQTIGEYFSQHKFQHYANMQYLNDVRNVPAGSKILFLGEAKTFYCRRDHVASTVFDSTLIEAIVRTSSSASEIHAKLRAEGITHIYVNTFELSRLQSTYRHPYAGREYLGMLDGFDWELFGQFAQEHLRRVKTFQGNSAETFPWGGGHFVALYELQ